MRPMALLAPLVLLLLVNCLPAEAQLLQKVQGAPQYSTLLDLLNAVNLTSTLSADIEKGTMVTIFAPNNTAFSGLNATCLTSTDASKDILKMILLYHVSPNKVVTPTNGQVIPTLTNQTLTIMINGSSIFVNRELVTAPAVVNDTQGVVHGLASVLIPPAGGAAEAVKGCLLAAPKPGAAPAPASPTAPAPPMNRPAPAPAPSAASALLVKSSAVLSLAAATAMAMLF